MGYLTHTNLFFQRRSTAGLGQRYMYYVDTSILISYVFASDSGHRVSRRTLEDIAFRQGARLYGSVLTLVEVCNVVCGKIARGEIEAYRSSTEVC